MLLSIERALINPCCCGFKSQVPEGGHHAWVTSDVRIPQQPLSCWSFADEAVQTLVKRSARYDVGHACKIKDSIRAIAVTRFRNYADLCKICVWQLLQRRNFQKFYLGTNLFMYLLFRRTLFANGGVLPCLIFISNFAILVTYVSPSRKQFHRDVINTPSLSTALHLSVSRLYSSFLFLVSLSLLAFATSCALAHGNLTVNERNSWRCKFILHIY